MKHIVLIAVLLAACLGCSDLSKESEADQEYRYLPPVEKNDGIRVSDLASQNMDQNRITAMVEDIYAGHYPQLEGILLFRNGSLILEEYVTYLNNLGRKTEYRWSSANHSMASCTKSVASVLAGLAFRQGFLKDLDAKIYDFFPEYHQLDWENGRRAITLRHLLTMRAGMYWDESSFPYTDARNSGYQLDRAPDKILFALQLEMIDKPGDAFCYNSTLPILLGAIIEKESGMDLVDFSRTYLFEPLGITDFYWYRCTDGTIHTGGGLTLSPRDMGKIGLLYLNNGSWNGQALLDPDWISLSKTPSPTGYNGIDYGFFWWIETFFGGGINMNAFYAYGYGEQYIICVPSHDLVCVIIGSNYQPTFRVNSRLMSQYILPATM